MQQLPTQGNISLTRESLTPPKSIVVRHHAESGMHLYWSLLRPILVSARTYIGHHSDLYTSDSLTQIKSHAAHRIPRPILSKLVHLQPEGIANTGKQTLRVGVYTPPPSVRARDQT